MRCVTSGEADWKLLGRKMHGRSHTVVALIVHLPDAQRIQFEEGSDAAVVAAGQPATKLTECMKYNASHPGDALCRTLTYPQFPEKYPGTRGSRLIQCIAQNEGGHPVIQLAECIL